MIVPLKGNDASVAQDYYAPMATQPQYDWYLKEWLATAGQTVAWLEEQTGWTHRIASQLVNRKTRWNRDHLNLAAKVLHLSAYELLMHPEDAMKMRRMRETALSIAADNRTPYTAEKPDDQPERLMPRKQA